MQIHGIFKLELWNLMKFIMLNYFFCTSIPILSFWGWKECCALFSVRALERKKDQCRPRFRQPCLHKDELN